MSVSISDKSKVYGVSFKETNGKIDDDFINQIQVTIPETGVTLHDTDLTADKAISVPESGIMFTINKDSKSDFCLQFKATNQSGLSDLFPNPTNSLYISIVANQKSDALNRNRSIGASSVLTFTGYKTVSVCITRKDNLVSFYLDGSLVESKTVEGELKDISINSISSASCCGLLVQDVVFVDEQAVITGAYTAENTKKFLA